MKNMMRVCLIGIALLAGMSLTTTVFASPLAASPSWSGEYFNNATLAGSPALRRGDPELNFEWTPGTSPAKGLVGASNYSVRWTREINLDRSGNWTFTTVNDDGIRVWVDNRITIDAWYDQGPTVHEGRIDLTAGKHVVRVEYYNRILGGTARLSYAFTSSFPNWKGEYFSNPDLAGAPTVLRDDNSINFDWGSGSPDSTIPSDRFSARWTRTLYLAAGTWRFTTTTDDGVRLWVDNRLIIDHWGDQSAISYSADIGLGAGNHTIRMEYYDRRVSAVARLSYAPVNTQPPAAGTWRGQYYNNVSLEGSPALVRDDPSLHFIWGAEAPGPGVSQDHFSAKWDSTQVLPYSGNYTVLVSSDDGVRVWVDGTLVIDAWYDHPAALFNATRWLAAGPHNVHVEYYDRTVSAMVGVDLIPVKSPAPAPAPAPAPSGDIIVDNGASGWQAGGSASDWRTAASGIGGRALWSYNNSYTSPYYNWARWYPALPRAGNYQVSVYIPGGIANTGNARYWVYHGSKYNNVTLSQGQYNNQWVSLGTYYFSATGGEFVSLSDVTYECYLCRTVAFDAVRFSPR